MLPIVRKACELVGGPSKLAEKVGVSRQMLYEWEKITAEYVLPIEAATAGQITRHEMRPDLYPKDEVAA